MWYINLHTNICITYTYACTYLSEIGSRAPANGVFLLVRRMDFQVRLHKCDLCTHSVCELGLSHPLIGADSNAWLRLLGWLTVISLIKKPFEQEHTGGTKIAGCRHFILVVVSSVKWEKASWSFCEDHYQIWVFGGLPELLDCQHKAGNKDFRIAKPWLKIIPVLYHLLVSNTLFACRRRKESYYFTISFVTFVTP